MWFRHHLSAMPSGGTSLLFYCVNVTYIGFLCRGPPRKWTRFDIIYSPYGDILLSIYNMINVYEVDGKCNEACLAGLSCFQGV